MRELFDEVAGNSPLDPQEAVRRSMRGPLPPSAHDVLREARLLRALSGTQVRAPRVLAVNGALLVFLGIFYFLIQRRVAEL